MPESVELAAPTTQLKAPMFKNLNIYRIASSWMPESTAMEVQLLNAQFVPCTATQDKSVGWVPPRNEANGALVESVACQRILRLRIETKSVPGSVVQKKAQEAADRIEHETGRVPGKKEMRALKEDALLALLPQAFEKQSDVWVWIDPAAGLLCTDASSTGKADEVVTALVNAFPDLSLRMLQTTVSPQTAMTQWLADAGPDGFNIERACELVSHDEEKSVLKFNRHTLETDQVREHISQGKLPKWTAMSYAGRVGFVLTENLVLRKIEFLEGVFDGRDANEADGFDADVALATGELQVLIPALIEALGGEMAMDGGAA
jgi:recombination associated protein RdgC